ncbi:VCBS domain-containing protein [Aquipseudomonas alcaligenes]|uniref:VCBS domain-containing protein n=1 Tax=Aquipseudomonas alcaligenes TaxID=43263 RepID=UPI0037480AA5
MTTGVRNRSGAWLRPQSQALALEPRILFDGAAAVAVEQQHGDASDSPDNPDNAVAHPEPSATPQTPPSHLLVIDSRVENRELLVQQLPPGVKALVVQAGQDGLAAIEQALEALGQVDSIQILSHGSAGQFSIGATTLSSDNIGQFGQALQQWSDNLREGADIQLYGCNVGAGEAGKTLVAELARWTRADVAASNNDTGAASTGGDWQLEVSTGDIDQHIALSDAALNDYDDLLANANPTTSLGSSNAQVLLGDNFTFTINFQNSSSQAGFAPYIDLFLPATGKDGLGAEIDDGITFVSANYLGQTLVSHVITFDANGKATHPLAVDTSGNALIIDAASFGMRAGDQLVVLELPFASVVSGQPIIPIAVTAALSNLADTSFSNGSPNLTVRARSGFQYGNDSLNNPSVDPSLVEAGSRSFVVTPTVVTVTQTVITPEGETATGPNYERTLQQTITPASGQTLSNVVVTQPIPGSVIVTGISTGGGTITSMTLYDGRTSTDPALIAAVLVRNNDADLSNDIYIKEFTIAYGSLSAATTSNVTFFVPEADVDGVPIINQNTGDDVTITFAGPSATGMWVPLDSRDVTPPATHIDFAGTGSSTSFVAKSITLVKQVTIQTDLGTTGITPGDTLQYTLTVDISDYFAFGKNLLAQGQFVIADLLGDGQTLQGTPTLSISVGGSTQIIPLVLITVVNADGSTSLSFDIAQSLVNAYRDKGGLNGDLAFDDILTSATTAVISYAAVVGQSYTPPAGNPHSEINEGDQLGNSATVTATVLLGPVNLSGYDESDSSSTTSTVPKSNIEIIVSDLNDGGAPAPGAELRPGDEVTFRLRYDLVTGDYENLKLTAYLPLPLFDLTGIVWQQGSGGEANVGQWIFSAGNTNADTSINVSNGAGNSLVFDLGSYVKANNVTTGSRIEIEFTMRVGDQPFADQREFDVLAQSSQTTTLQGKTIFSSSDVAVIASIAEPVLNISHGVVSSSNGTVTGTTGTTGTWAAPGTTGTTGIPNTTAVPPFTGSVTDLTDIDGDVSGIDGSDMLRLATAIENSGGGAAFDVSTSITLPSGLSFVGGSLASANLQIFRGDGTLLQPGTDYTVSGTTVTFVDGPGTGALLPGRSGTSADSNGENMIVITYDVTVSASIDASRTLESSASLTHYASAEGGDNFIAGAPLSDSAGQQIAAPDIDKVFAGGSLDDGDSSAGHTTGADLVVGESMLYDIVVTLPEGTTQSLRIDDLIPPGMRLDTSFNGNGYQLITTAGGALAGNFAGTITLGSLTGISGTLGVQDVDARFTFTAASATADNDTSNNSFVIRVRLVVDNTASNQEGVTRTNDARLTYSDPDGDTANGSTAATRNVENDSTPTITVREPVLSVTQQLVTVPPLGGFDLGSVIEFTITLSNNSGYDAFDISLVDLLPTQLSLMSLQSIQYNGSATNNGGPDFFIIGDYLRTASGANVDITAGDSIVLTLRGTVNSLANQAPDFSNTATAQWTSLDGSASATADPAGERTGVDGPLNGGTLNDYQQSSTLVIPAAGGFRISRVGGFVDTPAAVPTSGDVETVSIGEIVRYRVVVNVPEGGRIGYQIRVTLDDGLEFIPANLNQVLIGLISDSGLSSSLGSNLVSSGNPAIGGDQNVLQANSIDPNLANPLTAVLNTSLISVSADGRTVTFSFGNLSNNDLNDGNLEGLALEFNVRVSNQASNQAGDLLGVTARDYVNNGTTLISASQTLHERIVEPGFTGMDKTVIDFANPTGSIGTATVAVSFTQNGELPAYNVELITYMPNGTNYNAVSLEINGQPYDPSNPAHIALGADILMFSDGRLDVLFDKIDPGTSIKFVYTVDVPANTLVAASAANDTLTWSSLPNDFTGWGDSMVGPAGTTTGERDGTGGVNDYFLSAGAGLGIISGTLWNDTSSATSSTTPDGPGLAGQTVTLVWGGADGDLSTTGDNQSFTDITDANGLYSFGVLPSGQYRIEVPAGTISYSQPVGDLKIRIDSDGGALGQIAVALGEGVQSSANAGYVEQNDAPINTVPGTQSGSEDTLMSLPGISIADVDADRDPVTSSRNLTVTLSVLHGTLSLSGSTAGVTVSGGNSAQMVLTGTQANLNTALANLRYLGNQDYNGNDTLTVLTNDQGNFGDKDGNGIPGEATQDALTDQDTILIVLAPVNDAPIAVNDTALATEAGGTNNMTLGIDPRGSVLENDIDVDTATNGDVLSVVSITALKGSGSADDVTQSIADDGTVYSIVGLYGTLEISATGAYEYIVNNANPLVQALRTSGQTLSESFSYEITDSGLPSATANSTATLTVTIRGANDTPVGVDDAASATEAGGVANGSGGQDATGNVLTQAPGADTDVDSTANGETKRVTGARTLAETDVGPIQPVPAGTNSNTGIQITGHYGNLHIGADGSYRYVINNSNTTVQALAVGDTLIEKFTYAVTDQGGLSDLATLTITINGSQDNPVARDDSNTAQAGSVALGTAEVPAGGNVITGVVNGPLPGTGGADTDVDSIDNPVSTQLHVTGIRTGSEAAGGSLTSVSGATLIVGLYGSLTINPDGSYSYDVDSNNATVRALPPGATINELFTYQVADSANLTDLAQLTITITGVNDAPVVVNDTAQAVEAGGVNNQSPGVNPSGNVLTNDSDPDGDALHVSAISGGTVGQALIGTYGTLTLNANGTYTYVVNNSLPAVQALRLSSDQLNETFNYTVSDSRGGTSPAQLFVVISGKNDAPVATNDTGTATEKGGTNNASGGSDAVGNVLTNNADTDVDAGDSMAVNGIRTGAEAAGGAFSGIGSIVGLYGTLTINADGSYIYVINNDLPAVQALKPTDHLIEVFTYRMRDTAGATDTAELRITIDGAWDAPVAHDNVNYAVAPRLLPPDPGVAPSGNVLTDGRFFLVDSDVDQGDQLSVSGIGAGSSLPPGSLTPVSGTQVINGTYGTLTINSDGSYTYVVTADAASIVFGAADFVLETFTYQTQDLGLLTDEANLTILIRGQNDAPVAVDDSDVASDQTPAPQATGNVLPNDFDLDLDVVIGESLEVSAIRTGEELGTGTTGTLGTRLAGQYGWLVLNADGSYQYFIDMTNREVLAAAGLGQVLQDVFTYTVKDFWGASDQAQLVIHLEIAPPHIDPPDSKIPGGWTPYPKLDTPNPTTQLGFEPVVYVTPVVQASNKLEETLSWESDGSDMRMTLPVEQQSAFMQRLMTPVPGQFVQYSVGESRFDSELDLAWILGRQSRIELTADGLLSDPSLFASSPEDMTHSHDDVDEKPSAQTSRSFQQQLVAAAKRLSPLAQIPPRG